MMFTVPGEPVAWARARQHGKHFFTAPHVTAHKALVQAAALRNIAVWESTGPFIIECHFCFGRPKSWSKKKREETLHHLSKPDVDNLVKLIKDALNGIAWVDDSQVIQVHATKSYSTDPRTMVEISRP